MKRLTIILFVTTLFSCQDKVICPAFQSTYILDDSTRNAYFSYVWQLDEVTRTQYLASIRGGSKSSEDSVAVVEQPTTDYYAYAGEKVVPWRVQKRTKFGIIKNTPRVIKNYQLRTAPMENVLGPEVISNEFVASDFSDSLLVDSIGFASDSLATVSIAQEKPVEYQQKYFYRYDPADNFNVEQEYYNKYFGTRFIDDRPEPQKTLPGATGVPDSLSKEKVPFFKKLFQKKSKPDTVSASPDFIIENPEATEEDSGEQSEGNGEN